ncbi:alkaline phosphatase family protein [Alteromonas sp. CYL-A6]|uniref:alkaline phosphatase family protein n=1 Tax=Alteromonas nitratireducens TaxID=3390813 RepID=UPI0034B1C104
MSLPAVLAGPIVRRVTKNECHLWLVTRAPATPDIKIQFGGITLSSKTQVTSLAVGERAHIQLVSVTLDSPLEADRHVNYVLSFAEPDLHHSWCQQKNALLYPGQQELGFRWAPHLTHVLHGSCRKPHHHETDALTRADRMLADSLADNGPAPDILLLTGDQIYADDVAGPTLQAISQVIRLLGLKEEALEGAVINDSSALHEHPHCYYEREQLLPKIATNTALSKLFFGAKKKPVFTSVNAHNHLITLSEVLAMYLLNWSDTLWERVRFDINAIPAQHHERFRREQAAVTSFINTLPAVRRVLAQLPTYMIFDDHDVTDDWNLTRGWEEEVYGHPLSKRMVGNALLGYLLCQGWGNNPAVFSELLQSVSSFLASKETDAHNAIIDAVFDFETWGYQLDTTPPVRVLDTRTQRWRSESSANKPSGLMDWEALCEFQQSVIGKQTVILVSAAPVFGVKFIETVQKIFTFFGKALTVDAENWMAHKGTANVILNIFRHKRTPPTFIILSGDVHYSFVYDIRLRFRKHSPRILQFTCSGIKNAFPPTLICWLDRFNRWLYSPHSVLNIFTRRRDMSVSPRDPVPGQGELHNGSALGLLVLDKNGKEVACRLLCGNGDTIEFPNS